MKNFLILLTAFAILSCAKPIDEKIAKSKAEELLTLLKDHNYEKTSDYYTAEFNESEKVEARTLKFTNIEKATGAIQKFELIESNLTHIDERNMIILKYKVTCTNTVLTEVMTIAIEEGEYKVLNHQITNV